MSAARRVETARVAAESVPPLEAALYAGRRERLRKLLKKTGADALLSTNFSNVTYLTGFTGDDSYLLTTRREEVLITDFRFETQLADECPGLRLHVRTKGQQMAPALAEVIVAAGVRSLAVEGASIALSLYQTLSASLPDIPLAVTQGLVDQLRQIKDKTEIAATRRAVWLAEKAFAVIRAMLRGDQTERVVAAEIEHQIRLLGGKGCSFEPIVAAGPRGALPHARPSDQRIDSSGVLLIDWGADEGLYKSDLTRVLATGKIPPKVEQVYRVVLTAQQRAIERIAPGVSCHEVDAAARQTIEKAGFGDLFGHGTGHGLGIDIHEAPRLGPNQQQPLQPGMIVTVEPGIYLPGQFGVRIEDDVLVTKTGHEVLTSVPKNWEDVFVA